METLTFAIHVSFTQSLTKLLFNMETLTNLFHLCLLCIFHSLYQTFFNMETLTFCLTFMYLSHSLYLTFV